MLLASEVWLLLSDGGWLSEEGVVVLVGCCCCSPPVLRIAQKGTSSRRGGGGGGGALVGIALLLLLLSLTALPGGAAAASAPVLYPSGTDLRTRMPTVSRFASVAAGSTDQLVGAAGAGAGPGAARPKKAVIWRWAGSAAAPAKGRFGGRWVVGDIWLGWVGVCVSWGWYVCLARDVDGGVCVVVVGRTAGGALLLLYGSGVWL